MSNPEQKEDKWNQEIPEVEFINVHKTFVNQTETVSVLKGIDGKVEKGTITTIIGPSGSGKSTILSLCNLLQTPDKGEVRIQGKAVQEWDIQELRRELVLRFKLHP